MSGGEVPLPVVARRYSRGEKVTVTPMASDESFVGKIARVEGDQYTVSRSDGSRYYAHLSELSEA